MGEAVDALQNDVWWKGTVLVVEEEQGAVEVLFAGALLPYCSRSWPLWLLGQCQAARPPPYRYGPRWLLRRCEAALARPGLCAAVQSSAGLTCWPSCVPFMHAARLAQHVCQGLAASRYPVQARAGWALKRGVPARGVSKSALSEGVC